MPPPDAQRIGRVIDQGDLHVNPLLVFNRLDRGNLIDIGNDALGQAESNRKILNVGRRSHHHRMRGAAIGKSDRHLFRHDARSGSNNAVATHSLGAVAVEGNGS